MRREISRTGCEHRINDWCASCHEREVSQIRERATKLEEIIKRVGKWLKDTHRMRSKAFPAFTGQPIEQAKLEAQTHVLAQAHLILSGQLYLLNERSK